MWARCYLPDRPGGNRPGELLDVFYLDGKRWWTQAYDQAVPPEALGRQVGATAKVLRTAVSARSCRMARIASEMVGIAQVADTAAAHADLPRRVPLRAVTRDECGTMRGCGR